MRAAVGLCLSALLLLGGAAPAAAEDPTPAASSSPAPVESVEPQPIPPSPECPTGFPPGTTAEENGDSCYFISGSVLGNSQPAAGTVILARAVPGTGSPPAISSYAATVAADGTFALSVTPGHRWRLMLRRDVEAEAELIPISSGSSATEDAVFAIGPTERIVLDINLTDSSIFATFRTAVLQAVATPEPEPQYNPLAHAGSNAQLIPYDREFIEELSARAAAARSADPLTIFNLIWTSLALLGVAAFAWHLRSSPIHIEELVRRRTRQEHAHEDGEFADLG